jgi:bifunctional non-homologous end joining protein LigD
LQVVQDRGIYAVFCCIFAMTTRPSDPLAAYRAKREPARTPEPAGRLERSATGGSGLRFVVHKHAARRLHWDLRLEVGGVLWCWAVPQGPSLDPAEKRLAVHTEDHPLEYAEFEAVIPQGNYGAGAMIAWDEGTYQPLHPMEEGLAAGKLLFELRGHKLRGRWTLVKMRKAEEDAWLLIKERDALAASGLDSFPEDSVWSGLTVEELASGADPAEAIRRELRRLKAPRRLLDPRTTEPMLADTADAPFSRGGWVFEFKYDGYRALAFREDDDVRLLTRRGNDLSAGFPELVHALLRLPYRRFLLDGEIVVEDATGLPSFQRLQQRARLRRAPDVRRARRALPAKLWCFDLLGFEDRDLRSLRLTDRKSVLRRVLPSTGTLRYSEHVERHGEALYEQAERLGLEGVIGKKAESVYRGGRHADWLKVRAHRTEEFAVVGWTKPKGGRTGFGALHLAQFRDGSLHWAGQVGSGFTERQLGELRRRLGATRTVSPPCVGAPSGKEHSWSRPELVCEVRYVERTEDGLLRQPVFLRLREDRTPADCVWEGNAEELQFTEPFEPAQQTGAEPERAGAAGKVAFTNLDKVYWPEDGYTKGDLIAYYRAIAPAMLPYLRDRPVVLTRFPDGIHGKSFFQKDAPSFTPAWLRTVSIADEEGGRAPSYFVADDEQTLLYLANSGSIPLHVWSSRIASLERPDWCILDLDPKEAPFAHVVEVAQAARALCAEIGLPLYLKTSGSSGLHLLVPLGALLEHEHAKVLGELLARVLARNLPKIATLMRQVERRGGKVYIDYLQNGRGKLLVAPYSVRPLSGAPVSTPLRWSEVDTHLDIRRFTIRSVPRRVRALKTDPLLPVLSESPDLLSALEALQARL